MSRMDATLLAAIMVVAAFVYWLGWTNGFEAGLYKNSSQGEVRRHG